MAKDKVIIPTLNRVPSDTGIHAGIHGNKVADKAACLDIQKPITVNIPVSKQAIRQAIKIEAYNNWIIFKENGPTATRSLLWNQKLIHNKT